MALAGTGGEWEQWQRRARSPVDDERDIEMSGRIRVTNKFTGKATAYEGIEDFRAQAKEEADRSLTRLIDMLADAYSEGRSTSTYEWLLGWDVTGGDAA